jgi:monovalent cation:H+ antiporter, CPA1 family
MKYAASHIQSQHARRLKTAVNHKILPGILLLLLLTLLVSCTGSLANQGTLDRLPAVSNTHAGSNVIRIEGVIIALLLVAAVVSLVTQRLRIPYTVGLVLVGFTLTIVGNISKISIIPEIILALLVPPLVFEAAFHLNFTRLRRELPLILALAIPGVILTTVLVGGMVSYAAGISLPTALVFGALIAATDPVAVVALFRSMGVPQRLQVILEGESLLNDGTAIVIFNLMVAIAVTGKFSLGSGLVQFAVVAGGGLLVGAVTGIIVSQVIGRIDNYLVETALTTLLAYGSYLIAEYWLGVSGVLAVVAAGLAAGRLSPRGMSPTTRIVVFNFWEYAAFLANSFIFLIIGLQMDLNMIIRNAPAIGWAILAVVVARAGVVYGLSWVGKNIIRSWKRVLFWGGLRGAISLALALSLSNQVPNHDQLQAMAFGVVLFTLVIEGLTMKPLIRVSGLVQTDAAHQEYEKHYARAIALRAAQARLNQLNKNGLISDATWNSIKPQLKKRLRSITRMMHSILEQEPALYQDELSDAWREALRAQRSTLTALMRDNIVSEETYTDLVAEVDLLLANPERIEMDPSTSGDAPSTEDETAGSPL